MDLRVRYAIPYPISAIQCKLPNDFLGRLSEIFRSAERRTVEKEEEDVREKEEEEWRARRERERQVRQLMRADRERSV